MSSSPAPLVCRLCGLEHQPISLAAGESALCLRCDTVLASRPRLGPEAGAAFTVTGLILAIPAMTLPFITATKLGYDRSATVFTGVEGLWDHGMRLLAIWVCLCGGFVPLALFVILAGLLLPSYFKRTPLHARTLWHTAHALGHWAMPEVQVLAVLVALTKLGSLVDVTVGSGFWCYGAMSLALLLAWRNFTLTTMAPADLAVVDAQPAAAVSS